MTKITTHENRRIRRRPHKRRNMASSMARRIKDINTPVTEIIPSVEFANFQIERGLNDIPALEIFFPEGRAFFGRIAGEEFVFESRSNDQVD